MIKRYLATKDNTITNAYGATFAERGIDANMGQSDILEVFTIYGQTSSSISGYSIEEARILVYFDVDKISQDMLDGIVPNNAKFYLKLFNAEHGQTVPRNYTLEAHEVSGAWEEGWGLDMENYTDLSLGFGSNWLTSSATTSWVSAGGDVWPDSYETASFDNGLEDLEIDISYMIYDWAIDKAFQNDGILIKFPDSISSLQRSFYTKKFFARSSNHFFKRPIIEARWNSSQFDDRSNFFTYSSMSSQNNNTLYLYNYQRGQLVNIPSIGTGPIYVDLYETLGEPALTQCIDTPATGGWVSTGIYTASVCIDSTAETLYDVWHDGASTQFHTGTIETKSQHNYSIPPAKKLVVSQVDKLDKLYSEQVQRFYFNIREKGWSPNIYVVATAETESLFFNNLIYRIIRPITKETIINYDLIDLSTLMSYDSKGNYFDLDLNLLEPNEVYEINLALFNPLTKSYEELNFSHKFRVVNNEY